ncbi:uncharacterized protein tmem176l.1 [Neoarius graeffei]|uniref:uncharacterized protein tmem176l.1 n=1 Tax=Neoarius graeffei TaxID=443677 RepID=UPI00298C7A9F|nr:uncharacterized protein tmem176l.1 [Neoarius graeffei]
MSLTISRADGVTVYSVTSNHKSKWPLICQILGTMCYSPVCSVSRRLKQQLGCALTALATIQIMVGIINMGFGAFDAAMRNPSELSPAPLWLGGVMSAVGIMCILAERFPSPCLIVLTVVMNITSAALAITAIVLYSLELGRNYYYWCEPPKSEQHLYSWTTQSTLKRDEIFEKKRENYRICEESRKLVQLLRQSMVGILIVFAVLQLCVTISWCVLSLKALCKKEANRQDMEDPELLKPLMEEVPNPVC